VLLTSDEHILRVAENRIVAELELLLVLNQRPTLAPQSTHQLWDRQDPVALVYLVNGRVHDAESARSTDAIAEHNSSQHISQTLWWHSSSSSSSM